MTVIRFCGISEPHEPHTVDRGHPVTQCPGISTDHTIPEPQILTTGSVPGSRTLIRIEALRLAVQAYGDGPILTVAENFERWILRGDPE